MASHTKERAGNSTSNAADQVKDFAAGAAKSVGDALDSGREQVANAMDDAADTMGEERKNAPESAKRYSRNAKDKLHDVADYVRDNDAEDMGRDVMRAATAYPVASLLALSAVVIGGSMLVAAMLQDDGPADASGESRRPMRLASAVSGLGPRGTETLSRIRDAAFGFALDKAVDRVDAMFPGFRERYERG
jgi:ABC-type transporter Mla subunit MlaD